MKVAIVIVSENSQTSSIELPKLFISSKKGTVILVTKIYGNVMTGYKACGTVLVPGNDSNTYVGYYCNDWNIDSFKEFKGNLNLEFKQ